MEPVSSLAKMTGSYLNGNADCTLGAPDTPSALAQKDDLAEKVLAYAGNYFATK